MKRHFVLLFLLIQCHLLFSQKTAIKFDIKSNTLKDTVFVGYENTVTISGVKDMSQYVLMAERAMIAVDNKKNGIYKVKLSSAEAGKTITFSIMNTQTKKIVFTRKITAVFLQKSMIPRLPKSK